MKEIAYDHEKNLHTREGPMCALDILFDEKRPSSLLDIGCGTGAWLRAAQDLGVSDILGVDGVDVPDELLLIPRSKVCHHDLTLPLNLGRRFDVVFCFEVAEHLDHADANTLIESLVSHADVIYFSAACPGQPGQHHVNCQWPEYWQSIFNRCGYVCTDAPRWRIWQSDSIEPWYRQNMIVATKESSGAGKEGRIPGVVHPAMFEFFRNSHRLEQVDEIARGMMPSRWYLKTLVTTAAAKLRRKIMAN